MRPKSCTLSSTDVLLQFCVNVKLSFAYSIQIFSGFLRLSDSFTFYSQVPTCPARAIGPPLLDSSGG
jgi:hypothetical protein